MHLTNRFLLRILPGHRHALRAAAGLIALGSLTGRPLPAQTAPAARPAELGAEEPIQMMEFFVSEKGESRATNTIAPSDLELSIPGVAAEKLLSKIPGISVLANDPFAFYEFGNDIRVRAFAIDKLAVSLDGVPMGNSDPRYGTPIGRMVDAENLAAIKVSQGAGDVTTPAYQALGGSLQYFTRDPEKILGASFSATYGDFGQRRMFAKFETGELIPGLTSYISTSHFEFEPRGLEGIAKGLGRRLEAKIKYELDQVTLKYIFTYNDRDDFDTVGIPYANYQDLEAGNYLGTGTGWTLYTPFNYPLTRYPQFGAFDYGDYSDRGRRLGPPTYIDPTVAAGEGVNAQYFNQWRNGRMDYFNRVVADFDLTPAHKVKLSPYYQDKKNYGTFGVPKSVAEANIRAAYAADPTRKDIWAKMYYNAAGQPIDASGNVVTAFSAQHAVAAPTATASNFIPGVAGRAARDEDFGGHRYGLSGAWTWTTDRNVLTAGAWYEKDRHGAYRPTYNLEGGSVTGAFAYDQMLFLNYSRYFNTYVYQGFVQDTYKVLDGKLDLIGGWKYLKLDRNVRGFLTLSEWYTNKEARRSVSYEDTLLPQLGLLYRLTPETEVFFNYSENMATPPAAVLASPTGFVPGLLSPEYSDNFDLGIRGSRGAFSYTLQGYYIEYVDRILEVPIPISSGVGIAGQNAYQNVGGVDSLGAEASFSWSTPVEGLTLTGSVAYQKTTFQENLIDGVDVATGSTILLPIKDKSLGNTPEFTMNLDARYAWKGFTFNLGGRFYDSVYVNTLNTQKLPSYTTFEAAIAYSGRKGSALEGYTVALNAYNVFDQYFFTAYSYTGNSGDVQADQGRQLSLTLSAKF